jgi:Short C-terminal domain
VREVAHDGGGGTADELAKLADLRDRGVISQEEFEKGKEKALSAKAA